jgi:hypothetical protein
MNSLSDLINEVEAPLGKPAGSYYDWTRDFDLFKSTLNKATENAKKQFEQGLTSKIKNKSVMVRSSKGYKQPVKDNTIQRVTSVNINDFYGEWVVVLKNEFNKEFFLTPGYQIQILNGSVAPEQPSATAPTQPQNPTVVDKPAPSQKQQPAPKPPIKEEKTMKKQKLFENVNGNQFRLTKENNIL